MVKRSTTQPFLGKRTKIFLMCCEMKNFSAVARALDITQSAVSKAILQLESEVGFELFERNSRPLNLTPEAEVLYKHLRNVSGELAEFVSKIQGENFLKPVLRIGIVESLSMNLGMEIIKRYLPEVSQITVLVSTGMVLTRRLVERKLDIVISNDQSRLPDFILQKEIFEEPSVLLLPRAMTEDHRERWTWNQLQCCGFPLARFWDTTGDGHLNNNFINLQGLKFADRICVDSNSLTMALIKENIAWTFTRPTTVLQNKHLMKDVVVAPMPEPVLSRRVYVMRRKGEFEKEAKHLALFSEDVLRSQVVPKLLEFAPWIKEKIRIGEEPY